jgi:hypothetical protein
VDTKVQSLIESWIEIKNLNAYIKKSGILGENEKIKNERIHIHNSIGLPPRIGRHGLLKNGVIIRANPDFYNKEVFNDVQMNGPVRYARLCLIFSMTVLNDIEGSNRIEEVCLVRFYKELCHTDSTGFPILK